MTGKSAWLMRQPSNTVAGRVFCIPHAGCGSSVFRNWPREQAWVEFLPVELPGRLTRFGDPMPDTIQGLAAEMIDGIAPYLDVPFAFFGHCWSALVAYEAAVLLERPGSPRPAGLFVSSLMAPQDELIGRLVNMAKEQLAEELGKAVTAMGNVPHPELIAIYTNILRSDLDMGQRYVASSRGRLSCPIYALGWSDDTEVTPAQMTGWAECGDTTFLVLAGQHNRLVDAPPELMSQICRGVHAAAVR
jgi:surfactin synthase thioesterase subunit